MTGFRTLVHPRARAATQMPTSLPGPASPAPSALRVVTCGWLVLVVLAAILLALPASALAADRHATPSTFASTFAAAQGGDTIYLAAGSYGTWNGGSKPSPVSIKPEPGANVSIALNFNPASNITLDGI